ncbi:hypothetical protein, partial [Vogesella mureinivorans]|uniref:hypothetical protein n=1 Tax=Vogesella mureinivorans TaxID=657276 RepID=UPI0014786C35
MSKDVGAHGDASEQSIRLPVPSPALFNFSIQIIEKLVGFAGNSKLLATGNFYQAIDRLFIDPILGLSESPVLDKGL